MSKPHHDRVLDLLKMRDGMATDITLDDGRVVRCYNIAWGFDLGDPVAHITTNISPPNPERELPIDFFFANQVVKIVDPEKRCHLVRDGIKEGNKGDGDHFAAK